MVRPVTGADVGIRRAEIRPGLREIILCKDQDAKVGLRLRDIDNVSQHRTLFDGLEALIIQQLDDRGNPHHYIAQEHTHIWVIGLETSSDYVN